MLEIEERLYDHAAFAAGLYHWLLAQGYSDGNVMTISLECLLGISGKSLFVKILLHRLLITGQTTVFI